MQQTELSPGQLTPTLVVTPTPVPEQLQEWWNAMQGDDVSLAYADTFPQTLDDFRSDVARGDKMLLICLLDGCVAGALWLHDLVRRHDGVTVAGWIGCYFLRPYRGRLVVQFWQTARQQWESGGIRHFFAAAHVANRQSRILISQCARFRRVGRFPRFSRFHGQPVDLFIYSLHAEDTDLAWRLATSRAAGQSSVA